MMKKMMILFLSLFMLLFHGAVYAEEPEKTSEPETKETDGKKEEEKKEEKPADPNFGPEIKAQSAILIDYSTGTILARKNADQKKNPGGLTKLMGVYLACENLKNDKRITMSSEAFNTYDHNSSVIWVMEGETLSAIDLEYAAMIQNANDTMAMLAEAVSENQDAFLVKMNKTAEELGMTNTNFQNIFGLYNAENYSTAEDLAILTRKALRGTTYKKLFAAPSHVIAPTAQQPNERVLSANCELLKEGTFHNSDVTGCSLGYTSQDGFTLAVAAEKDGLSMIAILMGEKNEGDIYLDAKALFEYGTTNYRNAEITPEQIGTTTVEVYEGEKHVADVQFTVAQGFSALLSSSVDPAELKADVVTMNEETRNPNLIEAYVVFTLQGEQVGTAEMKKEIIRYDILGDDPSAPITGKQIFDYFSIAVLAIIVIVYLVRMFAPPSV